MWCHWTVAAFIALPLFLTGCAGENLRADTAVAPTTEYPAQYTTEVAVGKCAFKAPKRAAIAAIAGALLSSAISEGVNRVGIALQDAAEEKKWEITASRNIEVSNNTFGPCIQVVRGWFYLDPSEEKKKLETAEKWCNDKFIDKDNFTSMWNNQLWLAAPPDFVFEGRFDYSQTREALTVVPQYVRLDKPFAVRALRQGKDRHVAVFFTFHGPGVPVGKAGNPSASIIIGKLHTHEERTYPDPAMLSMTKVINRFPYESDWFKLKLEKDKTPLTVSTLVTEKQDASEFLGFVAAVFGGAKKAITEQLQTALIPEKQAAAMETAKTAKENAATTYDEKLVGALGALEECAQGDANMAKLAYKARSAMRALNQAARAGGSDEPFDHSVIDAIKVTGSPEEIKKACKAATEDF